MQETPQVGIVFHNEQTRSLAGGLSFHYLEINISHHGCSSRLSDFTLTDISLVVHRETKAEGSAHILLARHADVSEMALHQTVCLNHADARADDALVDGILATEKMLEHLLLVGGRDADARIADGQ